ncbi:MAG: Stealth CR1 domain-containing protein [Lentimicrobiaceae bacterium]|nr:Stealth CR1 domain-containing protein [Lentimicrobiaceae bacterium]
MDIDLVYLWVNGNDPKWRAKHDKTIGKTEEGSAVNCEGRYADNDELKYNLRAVEMYAPWIRRIFIVTDDQTPVWLNTAHPKVQIVDHTEILPPQSLPCFNPYLIEHFLYRIPGLSEHFLYANDDMFINRPVTPDTFFASDGLPIIRFYRRRFRKLALFYRERILKKKLENYVQVIKNTATLVEKRYGVYFSSKAHHNIDAYTKSEYEHIYQLFEADIAPTLTNHVRTDKDVQRHLYSYVALAEKRAHLQYVTQKTSFRFLIHNTELYPKLEEYNPLFFCMNDSQFANDSNRMRVTGYLQKRFPEKSQFEK